MNEHPDLPEDPQTQRARWELWAIFIIVAVVIVASLAWRAIGHHHAGPDQDQTYVPSSRPTPLMPAPVPAPGAANAPVRPGP